MSSSLFREKWAQQCRDLSNPSAEGAIAYESDDVVKYGNAQNTNGDNNWGFYDTYHHPMFCIMLGGGKKWKLHKNTGNAADRKLAREFQENCQWIANCCTHRAISKVIIDRACWWFQKVASSHQYSSTVHKYSPIWMAASVYVATREYGSVWLVEQIILLFVDAHQYTATTLRDVNHAISVLEKLHETKQYLPDVSVMQFITRFQSETLYFEEEEILLTTFVCESIESGSLIPDNIPIALAMGILYFMSVLYKKPLSKMYLSNYANLSEVTINRCYQKIVKLSPRLIPTSLGLT